MSILRLSTGLGLLAIASLLASCGVDREAAMWRGGNEASVRGDDNLSPVERDLRERAAKIAEKERKREAKRLAKITAERGNTVAAAPETPIARPAPELHGQVAIAAPKKRGGLFSGLGRSRQREGDGHEIWVNYERLESMQPAHARIEIDLGQQRARLFQKQGNVMALVVDTAISTGKAGFETPTGQYTIGEKSIEKRSTVYGTWLDANGTPVPSNGESSSRPAGASQFVGAEMPYWMRVTGGIGMHIGEVPGYPASHGCIRVPETIQPIIFSKVQVGTPVTITH
ncbi:MAG: L,D-transpeptidase [Verrucomicrobiae bacterium]|nr:L,D-transpeptidase [Verrucomicrobiae bacterium]